MNEGINPAAKRRVLIIKTSKHQKLISSKGFEYAENRLRQELFKAGFDLERPIELTTQPSKDQKIYEQAIRPEDDPKMPTRRERLKRGGSGLVTPS